MKKLIINADDFWLSEIFNIEILKLLQSGFIKSTTVMVDRIDITKQKQQLIVLSDLYKKWDISIWLHLEFFNTSFEEEIQRQFNKFFELFWFKPSHLDLHKNTYLEDSNIFIEKFCESVNLPMRNLWIFSTKVVMTTKKAFSWTNKRFEDILKWISTLEESDTQEILFHPGIYDPLCKSSLNKEREKDINNIQLINWILKENNIDLINYFDLMNINILTNK